MQRIFSLILAFVALIAVLALPACASLDGVGARVAASDVSIVDAALFVHEVADADFDVGKRADRIVLYRAIDTVSRLRRGFITRGQAEAEIFELLRLLRLDVSIRDPSGAS